ncbi:hypothetical protein SB768_33235, partial [Burkholderia sp. SIMBA_043]|uniref:hypothetical protein n=1 Tax=Burkholderia sp. SIMBA_043 TaxID=3085784 RepID=UPI0039782E21
YKYRYFEDPGADAHRQSAPISFVESMYVIKRFCSLVDCESHAFLLSAHSLDAAGELISPIRIRVTRLPKIV